MGRFVLGDLKTGEVKEVRPCGEALCGRVGAGKSRGVNQSADLMPFKSHQCVHLHALGFEFGSTAQIRAGR